MVLFGFSRRFSTFARVGGLAALSAFALTGCPADDGTGTGDAGVSVGNGIVVQDGEEKPYALNKDESSFVLVVPKANATGCGVFHSHAIEALQVGLEFTLDVDDAAASEMTVTLPSSQLRADANELRLSQPETADTPLSDSDRSAINNGMRNDQLQASDFPRLVFEVSNFSGLIGTGNTVDVAATIKDRDSTFTMDFEAAFDGDKLTITGEGVLQGTPHELPTGFGSNCLQSQMPVRLKLVLEPGVQEGEIDAGVVEPYVQKTFPHDGACDDTAGYNDIAQYTLRNCTGCHKESPILGATISLVEYDDWRVDTVRHPDQPVYETAAEFMQKDISESTVMPPVAASPMHPDDVAEVLAWVERGAAKDNCVPFIYEGFIPRTMAACGSPNYDDDIKPMMENNCEYCHDQSSNTEVPAINTYVAGLEDADHPFYRPLNLWEASYYRIDDLTMPPAIPFFPGEQTFDEAKGIYQTWIEAGYPEAACP